MRSYMLLSIALLLLVAAWVTACGGGPPSTEPADEAIASPIQRDEGHEATSVPTVEAQREEALISTPVPEAPAARLPTVSAPVPVPDLPDVFLIYGIRPPTEATPPALRSPEQYENDVIEAVTADLAKRLGVPVQAIRVAMSGYADAQVVSPCGGVTVEGEEGPLGGGLALGYEVVLEEGETQHRYVALGGLAYYCGAQ